MSNLKFIIFLISFSAYTQEANVLIYQNLIDQFGNINKTNLENYNKLCQRNVVSPHLCKSNRLISDIIDTWFSRFEILWVLHSKSPVTYRDIIDSCADNGGVLNIFGKKEKNVKVGSLINPLLIN